MSESLAGRMIHLLPGDSQAHQRLLRFVEQCAEHSSFMVPAFPDCGELLYQVCWDAGTWGWVCSRWFYDRARANLELLTLNELENLPLCELLETLVYIVRWERNEGYGGVFELAWEKGQIQAIARGIKKALERGSRPFKSLMRR